MKKIKFYLAGFFLLGIIVVACKKNDFSSFNNDKKVSDTRNADINNGNYNPLTNPNDHIVLQNLELLTGFDISNTAMPTNENEAVTLLTPLMENSLQYFYDSGLTSSDLIAEFSTLDNSEIAYVAIVLEAINAQGGISLCSNDNIWIKCLINMALPCSILEGNVFDEFRQGIIENGAKAAFKALPYSAKKTLITAIGKKAVQTFGGGSLSLAFFVYDYANCIINGDLVPSDNDLIDSNGFYVVSGLDVYLPFEFNASGGYWFLETKFIGNEEALRTLTSSGFQQISNETFYDGPNGLYTNLSQNILAPDGFYWAKDIQNTSYRQFFYLKDGFVTIVARKFFN